MGCCRWAQRSSVGCYRSTKPVVVGCVFLPRASLISWNRRTPAIPTASCSFAVLAKPATLLIFPHGRRPDPRRHFPRQTRHVAHGVCSHQPRRGPLSWGFYNVCFDVRFGLPVDWRRYFMPMPTPPEDAMAEQFLHSPRCLACFAESKETGHI